MTSETAVSQRTRLTHIRLTGGQNWRNNSGVLFNEQGTPVRYGLANESKQQNATTKSSDIIGITPTLITQQMVGYYLGVFTAMEIKDSDWTFPLPTNKKEYAHCLAQSNFHDIVRAACGFAGFVTDPERDVPRIIRGG